MKKLNFVDAYYQTSDSHTMQGNRKAVEKFLQYHPEFHIYDERNGFWILVKGSDAIVELEDPSTSETFSVSLKTKILVYYKRQKFTQNLFYKFYDDASSGKINFTMKDSEVFLQ